MKVILVLSLASVASALQVNSAALVTPKDEPKLKDKKDEGNAVTETELMSLNELLRMFDGELDMEEGEAEFLGNELVKKKINKKDYKEVSMSSLSHMTGRQRAMWMLAAKEERDAGNHIKPSRFARSIPKIPRSYVEAINNLDHTHIHNFMFSGSVLHKDLGNRKWLKDFVAKNFNTTDYYRATDAGKKYEKIGAYDHSDDKTGYRPKDHGVLTFEYDSSYWKAMTQSNFVVCPGGDAPWSYRFYETFVTKAIPVINSRDTDWKPRITTSEIDKIGYEYKTTKDDLKYDAAMAERNYAKFMKYQTWIEGDNNPSDAQGDHKQYID